jgi:hypothetical protein
MNTPQMPALPLWACLLVVALGIFWHASSKLSELENRGQAIDVKRYILDNKWTAFNVVMGAYMLFMVEWYMGTGGAIPALLTGISCNSVGDKLRARAEAQK